MNLYKVLTVVVLHLFLSTIAYADSGVTNLLKSHHSSSNCNNKTCTSGSLVVIADIKILGITPKACLLLENNVVYQPLSQTYRRVARTWKTGDTIRLYKIENKEDRFFLFNFTTGETIKARLKCL